jgi:hypothetical protein
MLDPEQFQRDIDEILRGPGDDYVRLRCIRVYTDHAIGRALTPPDQKLLELIKRWLGRELSSPQFILLSHEE